MLGDVILLCLSWRLEWGGDTVTDVPIKRTTNPNNPNQPLAASLAEVSLVE